MFSMIHRSALVASMFVALVSSGEPALRGPKLGEAQKVKQWGYSLRIVEGWAAVPGQPGELFIAGQWKADEQAGFKKGDVSSIGCEVTVYRLSQQGASTGVKEKSEEEKKKEEEAEKRARVFLGSNWEKRVHPKSMDEYLDGIFEGAAQRWMEKDIKADKLTGKVREFTHGATAMCIGCFKDKDVEWAIVYKCFEEQYKKVWVDIFKQSIQSFKTFEPEGKADAVAAGVDPKKLKGEEKRKYIKAGITGSPGWYAIDTRNYVFLSNSPNRDFVQSLSREIETIREKVYQKLFPPQKVVDTICIARVLANQGEYYQYGGPRGSAGYWNSEKEELVLFDGFEDVTKKNSKEYTRSVMYHEAFHQYIHYAVGDLAPHSWFNEGHGDYFAGMSVSGGNVSVAPFEWRTTYLKQHLRDKKDLIPVKSLVRLPQSEYYTNGGLKYSEGWALIYFFRKVTNNARWKQIPDTYFKYLSENIAAFRKKADEEKNTGEGDTPIPGIPDIKIVNFEDRDKVEKILSEAVDKAFEGVDFEKLDNEFQTWVKGL